MFLLSNCISFRDNKVAKVTPQEINISSKTKVKIFTSWKYHASPNNQYQEVVQQAVHEKLLRETITASECCNIVSDEKDADIILNGSFYDKSNPAALVFAVITGLSLYTIPSWTTIDSTIATNLKKGTKTYEYKLNDSMVFAQWLPFAFAFPFRDNPIKEEEVMKKNLYNNLILKMKEDGVFKK